MTVKQALDLVKSVLLAKVNTDAEKVIVMVFTPGAMVTYKVIKNGNKWGINDD